jgi:Iap family predicted aminopeptidase
MENVKKPIREALETLKEMQNYESSYAQINKFHLVVNRFAQLERACDLMAGALAEVEGSTKEEVLQEYLRRAEL